MKHLLNTLYVMSEDSYLYYRNENVCVRIGDEEKVSVPALSLEAVVCFGQKTVSTPLLGFCAERGITLTFLSPNGRFYGSLQGQVSGNILLRKKQFRALDDLAFTVPFVRNLLFAKIGNGRNVLMRAARDTDDEAAANKLQDCCGHLGALARQLSDVDSIDSMRGIEGTAAKTYFSCFDDMLSGQCPLRFGTRSRRPPLNEVNAALSFAYTLLTREIKSALETVGLDPAAGFMHVLRPGRPALALDLLEELRAPLCDRFVVSMLNKRQLTEKSFTHDSRAVLLNDDGRKLVVTAWQKRKQEEIMHPFLKEKVAIGLIPYTQAMLLARTLRGDLDLYPPFRWR